VFKVLSTPIDMGLSQNAKCVAEYVNFLLGGRVIFTVKGNSAPEHALPHV
jgi:hypothetical protein